MRCVPQNPPRAAASGLTMLQFGGAFCIDPEQPRPSSLIQNQGADCFAAVRVR
jgi:hypothetical protein